MNKFANEFDRLLDLAGLVCDEIATQEDLIELNALMHADKASCGRYLDYCRVHGGLRLESRARHVARRAYVQINTDAGGSVSGGLDVASTQTTSSPVIAFSSDAFRNTFAYFSSGWPAAYLIAAVIMGIGTVIGALTHVSHPGESVGHSTMTAMNRSASPPQEVFVGRITAMVGCKLADQSKPPSRRVVMGNNYSIASGLLEITYDTGAKVILQGPCTYQVDSTNGGYLSIGKLTARVEQRGERSGEREGPRSKVQGSRQENLQTSKSPNPEIPKSPNPQLTTNHYPLFTIKTPTAVITDLGTEFGVEVQGSGATSTHVFRGSIKICAVAQIATGGASHILHENESAFVERVAESSGECVRLAGLGDAPIKYVRDIREVSKDASEQYEVIAFWKFDGDQFLSDSSGHGHALVNQGVQQVNDTALFEGGAILSTIDSIDLTPYKKVRLSWSSKSEPSKTNQIIWEHSEEYNYTSGAIIAYIEAGDGFAGIRNARPFTDQKDTHRLEVFPVKHNVWEHYAVEYDRTASKRSGIIKVYKDGILIGRGGNAFGPAPASFANAVFHIGAREGVKEPFTGQIDNMKIEGAPAKYENDR